MGGFTAKAVCPQPACHPQNPQTNPPQQKRKRLWTTLLLSFFFAPKLPTTTFLKHDERRTQQLA